MSNEIEAIFEIKNTLGLHARPASLFVQVTTAYESDIFVEKDGEVINAKSLMGLLMLSAGYGTQIKVTAKGSDSKEALDAIEDLIERNFDEE